MRKTISLALTLLLLIHLAPPARASESVASQITALPAGTSVDLRLKNKQKMRGTTGQVSSTGFMLVDVQTGEHQIAFDDVAFVKPRIKKSHLTRNILIGAGIGVVALGITAAVLLRCAPLGCNPKF
jgi:hypothetical protein